MQLKAPFIKDLLIRKPALPYLAVKTKSLPARKEKLPLINCIAFSMLVSPGTVIKIWT